MMAVIRQNWVLKSMELQPGIETLKSMEYGQGNRLSAGRNTASSQTSHEGDSWQHEKDIRRKEIMRSKREACI